MIDIIETMRWYADPKNWKKLPSSDGDPECDVEAAVPGTDEDGVFCCDCGDKARDALRAYAAQDAAAPDQPAEVREVVFNAIHDRVNEPKFCSERDLVDAVLMGVAAAGYRITRDAPARPTVGETWETPEGPVMVVPLDPTEAMADKGHEEVFTDRGAYMLSDWDAECVYRAMLAATAKEKPHAG